MQAYTDIIPPTAVSHAIVAPILSKSALNLVVAKTSLLQIFEVRTVAATNLSTSDNNDSYPTFRSRTASLTGPRQKLVLMGEFPVAGTITSLASASVPNTLSGGDILLVATKTAKISVVEWDPLTNAITTQSIHYYENQPENDNPALSDPALYTSWLCVDPRSTCALFKFGKRSLAVIPFRQAGDVAADEPDPMLDDDADSRLQRKSTRSGDATSDKRHLPSLPTLPSYTLVTTHLDPLIREPIDIAFLHEYREPTVGILYTTNARSLALAALQTVTLTFVIYTLDVSGRARTKLFSIDGLPQDVFKIVPLPLPVGGVLLVGTGQLIHVDQSGKTFAIAVNPFALQNPAFSMNDQSHLAMKLEHCVITRMSHNLSSLLLVLRSGGLATLNFKMEGRTLSNMTVEPVSPERGRDLAGGMASCAAVVGLNTVFIGSAQSDGVLFECQSSMPELLRKRTHADMLGRVEPATSEEDPMDEDDDLYGGSSNNAAPKKQDVGGVANEMPADISFVLQDILPNYAALTEPTVTRRCHGKQPKDAASQKLELVLPTGINVNGSLSFLSRSVPTTTAQAMPTALPAKRAFTATTQGAGEDTPKGSLLIIDHKTTDAAGASTVWRPADEGLEEVQGTEFERDIETLFASSLLGGKFIAQVNPTAIRLYDKDLNLVEMYSMDDDTTEYTVQHASFTDSYILVIRDDASAIVLKVGDGGDLQDVERGEQLRETSWASGSLHHWTTEGSEATMYLLSEKGALHIYALPDTTAPIYVAEDLRNLPPILTASSSSRRGGVPEPLAELLVAELGDSEVNSPFLVIRTEGGDVELYEPFSTSREGNAHLQPKQLRWLKRPCSLVGSLGSAAPEVVLGAGASDERPRPPMVALHNLAGYYAVFVPGAASGFIFKEASSLPKALPYEQGEVYSVALWNVSPHHDSIIIAGETTEEAKGSIKLETLSQDYQFGHLGWAVKRLHLGAEANFVAYHTAVDRLIISVDESVDFILPDDEAAHHAWVKEEIPLRPQVTHSTIQLLDPETWTITDSYSMPYIYEQVSCMSITHLEVSEKTHERRSLLAVGTAMVRGEDLPANGCIYLFDIVRVAPNPQRPGTELALKLIVREEVRGFVTALCEAGDQGLLLIAMGQKLNVRGLTDAGTLLPAAFMDAQIRVKSLKNLKGTGMSLVADALKGVWFVGFQAEPFRMHMLSKSRTQIQVAATDFLPHEGQLMIIVADQQGNLHMLEYKPEHPLSQSGQRLLHKAAIHCGHGVVSLKLLPCAAPAGFLPPSDLSNGDTEMANGHSEAAASPFPDHQVLVTHTTGAMSLIHPLSESSYRRLTALQTFMTNALDSPCGLNTRSYRAVDPALVNWKGAVVEGSTVGASGGNRSVVDGAYPARWRELGVRGRAEAWGRVGGFVAGAQPELIAGIKDVEIMRGAGLTYF